MHQSREEYSNDKPAARCTRATEAEGNAKVLKIYNKMGWPSIFMFFLFGALG